MAEAGIFTITELRQVGGVLAPNLTGERFAWSAGRQSNELPGTGLPSSVTVGAFAIPLRPWSFGGELRSVRTEYNGANRPSEQVQGPKHKPFTLTGYWKDKYNSPGWARDEMKRFEAMCNRGNVVRISYQQESFDCLIKDWNFDYERSYDITYTFTTSVHGRPGEVDRSAQSPPTALGPTQHYNSADAVRDALESANQGAPVGAMTSGDVDIVEAHLASITTTMSVLDDTIDQRELSPTVMPTDSFKKMATQFRTLMNNAFDLEAALRSSKASTDVGVNTAMNVLEFETWTRDMRHNSRVMMGVAQDASSQLEERAEPNAIALYRPFRGESLYGISQRFYSTPHAWRLIADRNALQNFTLDGTELLVIPERGDA